MSLSALTIAAPSLVRAAEEAAEHSGASPWLIGGVAFGLLMALLGITMTFNADR
jgi:hypothetical protein